MSGKKEIFVFGSNEAGKHGAGAAADAYARYGARYGMGYGHYGQSFAVPTKDQNIQTLPLERIKQYVEGFLAYAQGHPELIFKITRIGCGLAGLKDHEIASMFLFAPSNCYFDEKWMPYVTSHAKFWGTF